MNAWIARDPHSGGIKIPEKIRQETSERRQAYGKAHYTGKYSRLEIRYRGA